MTTRAAIGWSALAGGFCALAFDPWSVPWAMLVGLVGLAVVVKLTGELRIRSVVAYSLAFSTIFICLMAGWMRSLTVAGWLGLSTLEIGLLTLTVFAMWLVARLPAWPFWVASVWTAGEWLRGSFPFNGFPWGRVAHAAIDTPFAPWARLVGLPTTSFLIVIVACLAIAVFTERSATRIASAVAAPVILLAGLVLPTGVAAPFTTKQVSIIQGDTPGAFLRWPYGEIFANHVAETEKLALEVFAGRADRPDLVIWPENATDIDLYENREARTQVERLADVMQSPILVGGIFNGAEPTVARNMGVVWTVDGPGESYVKRRPVPFGEYVPFRAQLDWLVPRFNRDIPRDMLPGTKDGALTIDGTVWGDTICYDIAYDGLTRDLIERGAGAIVVQTSNAAFHGSAQPDQQWDISRMRAIETGRQVLVASTNGISGIIDADGSEIERAPTGEPVTINHEVTLGKGTTTGVRLGGWLEGLWIVAAIGGISAAGYRRRKP